MIKKAWITDQAAKHNDLFALSFESETVKDEEAWQRLSVTENCFPVMPKDKPKQHTIVIRLLDQEDINKLAQLFDQHRTDIIPHLIQKKDSDNWQCRHCKAVGTEDELLGKVCPVRKS